MSQRASILKAIEEELAVLENSDAMNKADGKGVQAREVHKDAAPSKSEKKKGFKLSGGGQAVGGDAGGVTSEAIVAENEAAMDTADGTGVASTSPKDVNGTDANGAPGYKANGSDAKETEKMGENGGSGVADKSVGKSKVDGSVDGKAVEKAKGKSVASTSEKEDGLKNDGVEENVIILPTDTVVEENGVKKTLKAGTKVVIGEMFDDMGGASEAEMISTDVEEAPIEEPGCIEGPMEAGAGADEAMITAIVTAVVQALNGGGEYDYAMEGKEVQVDALLEDVNKILSESGKPWEKDDDKAEDNDGEKDNDGEMEECSESTKKGKSLSESKISKGKVFGEGIDGMMDGDFEDDDADDADTGDVANLEVDAKAEVDKTSPDYIAALVDDIADDFSTLKDVLGSSEDEDYAEEEDGDGLPPEEEEFADEEEGMYDEEDEEFADEEDETDLF